MKSAWSVVAVKAATAVARTTNFMVRKLAARGGGANIYAEITPTEREFAVC